MDERRGTRKTKRYSDGNVDWVNTLTFPNEGTFPKEDHSLSVAGGNFTPTNDDIIRQSVWHCLRTSSVCGWWLPRSAMPKLSMKLETRHGSRKTRCRAARKRMQHVSKGCYRLWRAMEGLVEIRVAQPCTPCDNTPFHLACESRGFFDTQLCAKNDHYSQVKKLGIRSSTVNKGAPEKELDFCSDLRWAELVVPGGKHGMKHGHRPAS